MPQIISIVGKSKSGKTTLIEKLIPVLKTRGYRVGTVKHAGHALEIDQKGKDSWRHKAAGAETVVISSPGSITMFKDSRQNTIDDLCHYFQDIDLVITEGFKNEQKPRIEVFRETNQDTPISIGNPHLVALVSDTDIDLDAPCFGLEEVDALADLIEKKFL